MLRPVSSFSNISVTDPSNGYESVAPIYIAARDRNPMRFGAEIVARWARRLPFGATVLDLGCGPGIPITQTLIDEGLRPYGVDASPSMIAAFRERFPDAPSVCERVEESSFFGRKFDAAVSWGLLFLLQPDTQATVIRRVSEALEPGGSFLFTAPWQIGSWSDSLTGLTSYSLGSECYRRLLTEAGFHWVGDDIDEGDNYYYFAQRASAGET
jgi:SAM-dependent methyltransferase